MYCFSNTMIYYHYLYIVIPDNLRGDNFSSLPLKREYFHLQFGLIWDIIDNVLEINVQCENNY